MPINKTFRQIGYTRGATAETIVEQVVQEGQENNTLPEWLVGYQRANLKDDMSGVDGWILTSDVGEIKLQIKSSFSGVKKFERNHHRRDIAIVIIKNYDSSQLVLEKIITAVSPLRREYLSKRQSF